MARMTPETHDEILATAARRFAFAGYKGTSLQDIARDVGCSKAAVLYHFPNKEAILTELMAPALAVLQALDDRIVAATGPADAQRVAMEGFVDLAVRFRREIALLLGEFQELLETARLRAHPADLRAAHRCGGRAPRAPGRPTRRAGGARRDRRDVRRLHRRTRRRTARGAAGAATPGARARRLTIHS